MLDLDTLIIRPTVSIDGVIYEILSADEMSVIESHRFGLTGKRIEALAEVEGAEAEEELAALVDHVARKVLVDVPDEVFAKLSGSHKWAVVDVFTGLLLGNRLGVAGAMQKAMAPTIESLAQISQSTGATGSPGSSGSTAATLRGGWAQRLRAWFGRT